MTDKPRCERIEVDGEPVLARSARPLTEADIQAIRDFAETLRRKPRSGWRDADPGSAEMAIERENREWATNR